MNLRDLWLGRNRITKIENLGHLTGLRRISLQVGAGPRGHSG